MTHDAIAVIDFGGQYAHLIATKVRRLRVLAEIRQPDDPTEAFQAYKGIIISGSPSLSSFGEDSAYNKAIYDLPVPILGLCFGHQEIAKHYGGTVTHGGREWGPADLHVVVDSPLFKGLARTERVWMSHFDSVTSVGPEFREVGFTTLGGSEAAHRYAAIGSDTLRRYGVQFHPEVDDTVHGSEMIANFVFDICGCQASWTMERYVEERIEQVRQQVGGRSVFLLASGGVDSTVAARLLGLAIGADRLHLLHVDNGLMRKHESQEVLETFRAFGLDRNLHFVDASDDFLTALAGAVEPEAKRTVIGNTFIEVFEREARRLGIEGHLLGQGTIYPDTIETGGTRRADTIKTHHNRVPVIERMIAEGRVVEPLADLYKVEVRELGEKLGIPHGLVWRHPFPGPGLGVRLLCSSGVPSRDGFEAIEPRVAELAAGFFKDVPGINRCVWNLGRHAPSRVRPLPATVTRDRLDLLREADHLVMAGLRRHGIYDDIWQCPTAMLPLEVDGCGREFIVVRPIHSERAMTATPARLPEALLGELREQVLRLPGVSGLALDITTKPPGTIEWE
ncbi:MAG: glutamine-hydrolyzing GMP synthase [Acidobacteria bacterium]|nr:glutamine-hydrolyzing GMP synthase [Acidobacteriota bacterium]